MPLRAALNLAYALITEGADTKQRQEIDDQLYGWGDMNKRAQQDLYGDGGES
jgi:hypothetical protein